MGHSATPITTRHDTRRRRGCNCTVHISATKATKDGEKHIPVMSCNQALNPASRAAAAADVRRRGLTAMTRRQPHRHWEKNRLGRHATRQNITIIQLHSTQDVRRRRTAFAQSNLHIANVDDAYHTLSISKDMYVI